MIIIAIDGPSAAGKGTLARTLAQHFNLAYLDTGALYRAVGYLVLQTGADPKDAAAVVGVARTLQFDFRPVGASYHAFINGTDVEENLRTQEVGSMASKISSIPEVRAALKTFQTQFAQTCGKAGGAVLDGRDIGTVIYPQANVKLFLVADPMVRAKRRHKQLVEMGKPAPTVEEIYQSNLLRDKQDEERTAAPLKPAADALVLDTSLLDAAAVFTRVATHIEKTLKTLPKKEQKAAAAK